MTSLMICPFPLRCLLTCLFLLLTLLPSQTTAQDIELVSNRDLVKFPVTTGTPHFAIDLDYPQAFELKIDAYNYNDTETGFCKTYPSQITSRIEWSGPINTTNDESDGTGLDALHSYDNIEFYKGYYFILDSLTFQMTVIKDFANPSSYITIESDFANQDEAEQLEDTYLMIDPDNGFLYIITRKKLLYYSLTDFLTAVDENQEIPKIKDEAPNFRGLEMILSIRYYKRRLYIVADNVVHAYMLSGSGQITPQITFDSEFFGVESVNVADIAFRGDYSFVLDQLKGIYVVDISNEDMPHHSNLTDKFRFQPDETTGTQKGQFIEIVGDSLHVVSSGTRNPYIFEYIIVGDPVLVRLDFNRKIELYQSVRDTYTDSNFFYLLTGFFNMVTKHSIPGRYFSQSVEEYLTEYWPVFGAKALVSQAINKTSRVAVLHEDFVTVMMFEEANPYISCDMAGVQAGIYSYKLNAVLRDCPAKRKDPRADWNTVCEVNQEILLEVIQESADVIIGDVTESRKELTPLYVGIAIIGLLIVVAICLVKKYKTQYNRLEEKIKFKKLGNESTDNNIVRGAAGKGIDRKPTVDSQQEIDPYTINIQAELEKVEERERKEQEERERKKSPIKSPQKSPHKPAASDNEHPNADIGDMKPLDIEEIYGKGKAAQNDSF